MKTLFTLALLAALSLPAGAQFFTSPTTQVSSNVAYAVAPKGSRVTFLAGYGEKVPQIQLYRTTASTLIASNIVAGLSNVCVVDRTIFAAADTVLLHHVSAGTFERFLLNTTNTVGSSGALLLTNELTSATVASAFSAGDVAYKLTAAGVLPISTAVPTSFTAGAGGLIWYAEDGPTLFQVKDLGTPTTNQFCTVSGVR